MDCYLNEKHHHVVLHRRGIFSTHFAQHEMTDEHEVEIWRKLVVGCAKMIGVFTDTPRVGVLLHEKNEVKTNFTAVEFRRYQGYAADELRVVAQADGCDYVVEVPAGDYLEVTLDGDLDGDITITGPGDGNAVRDGKGRGNATRTGAGVGDAARIAIGDGHALRDGPGAGGATRAGSGRGNAVRIGEGRGDALRAHFGHGHALRDGAGDGDASRTQIGRGNSQRSGSGKGDARKGGPSPGTALRNGDGVGDAVRREMGQGRAFRVGEGEGRAWNDVGGYGGGADTEDDTCPTPMTVEMCLQPWGAEQNAPSPAS